MANKYLFNGKEIQDALGLNVFDFEARMYDPAIGRTFQLDPHADSYHDLSGYSWVANNPLANTDPTGMDIDYGGGFGGGDLYTGEDMMNLYSQLRASEEAASGSESNTENDGGGEKKKEKESNPSLVVGVGEGSEFQNGESEQAAYTFPLYLPWWGALEGVVGGVISSAASIALPVLTIITLSGDTRREFPLIIIPYAGGGNENYPGPWSYTTPDRSGPFYNPPSPNNPDNLPNNMDPYTKVLIGMRLIYELYDAYTIQPPQPVAPIDSNNVIRQGPK